MIDSLAPIVGQYRINASLVTKSLADMTPEDILVRPNGEANSALFIFGHITHHRHILARILGVEAPEPWGHLFGRGVKVLGGETYPEREEITLAFQHVTEKLDGRFESLTEQELNSATDFSPPGMRKIVRDTMAFLSLHETYHVGQLAYIRRLFGYNQLVG